MAGPTKNDTAWARLLDAKGIDLQTATLPIEVSMTDLKTLGGREPRLMLSMDKRSKWPSPLRDHGVIALSTSNTSVSLLHGDAWFDFPTIKGDTRTYKARLPFKLASSTIGKGENAHIMRLETSGFLADFLGTDRVIPVASGKRMAPPFTFTIGGQAVNVAGAQYEMDAQYESMEDIIPVEMKAVVYDSCAIRQVYYPFRSLGEDTSWQKPVRPLYVMYDEKADTYGVRELGFRQRTAWDSIHQVQGQAVRIELEEPPRRVLDLQSTLLDDYRIPQADNVARIAEYPLLVARGITTSGVMAEYYGFNQRQSSYYRDAVQSLGLVEVEGNTYRLTPDGRRYINLDAQQRADFMAGRMSRLPVLRTVLERLDDAGDQGIHNDAIPNILRDFAQEHDQPLSMVTAKRRASTIRAYLRYIGSRTGTIIATGGRFYLRSDLPSLDQFLEE